MATSQRATVYLPSRLYRALKVKADASDRGFSELITEAVELFLKEDTIDKEAFRDRRKEPSRPYSEVLRDLKQ